MISNLYNLRIKELLLPEYNIVKIILSDGLVHTANLSSDFSKLFCYPENLNSWKEAFCLIKDLDLYK